MNWDRPSERILSYIERLSEACLARDHAAIDTLLRLKVASHLPRKVLDEAEYFRRARTGTMRAPLHLLRFAHAMRQLAAGQPDQDQLTLPMRAGTTGSARRAKASGLRRAARRR